jgi:hypothetical protein
MKRVHVMSLAALVLAISLLFGVGMGNAAGRDKVVCKFVKINGKKRVECPKKALRGKAGPAGPAGPQGPAGVQGPAGAGSGLTLNFNAKLSPGQVKQVSIGNFTLRAAAQPSGACENIKLLTEVQDSLVSIGSGGPFSFVPNNSSVDLQAGDDSDMFTVVTLSGGNTMSGIVGRATQGGFCLVSGYVTGA